jgi:glutaconate CoA-transferase subunit B
MKARQAAESPAGGGSNAVGQPSRNPGSGGEAAGGVPGAPGAAAFSSSEMMIVAAARELAGQRVCFVGVGLPNIAVNLARRTVAPGLELVYESGAFGAKPARLPLSIGDPCIVTGATAVVPMLELFGYYLQGGLVDVGFLGAAQIDRFGNINTTVIGDYEHPRTRLPGSGGACEIAINARQVFVIMRQSKRSFVEKIDFRTSPGNLGGAETAARIRREQGWLGSGPSVVVTDLGIYRFDETGEMRLESIHPGVTLEQVRDTMGWEPKIADSLPVTPAPTAEELRLIREELDPEGAYTK